MVNPATVMSIIQLVKFGVETLELANAGKMTDQDIADRLTAMREKLDSANREWIAAGASDDSR